jgi:hypothetical protein
MGWMDRLRAMFGGGPSAEPARPRTDAVEEELAEERVEHDLEQDREAAVEDRLDTPTTLDD